MLTTDDLATAINGACAAAGLTSDVPTLQQALAQAIITAQIRSIDAQIDANDKAAAQAQAPFDNNRIALTNQRSDLTAKLATPAK